jgi:predicted Zn-dependent protease
MFLAGAGNTFGSGGDNFEWADYWEVFDQRITHETTFLENGDVDGSREIKLDHAAISIREDEGSGGLIYFNGEKFISIHQGD